MKYAVTLPQLRKAEVVYFVFRLFSQRKWAQPLFYVVAHLVPVPRQPAALVEPNVLVLAVEYHLIAAALLRFVDEVAYQALSESCSAFVRIDDDVFDVSSARAPVQVLVLDEESCAARDLSVLFAHECVEIRVCLAPIELLFKQFARNVADSAQLRQ